MLDEVQQADQRTIPTAFVMRVTAAFHMSHISARALLTLETLALWRITHVFSDNSLTFSSINVSIRKSPQEKWKQQLFADAFNISLLMCTALIQVRNILHLQDSVRCDKVSNHMLVRDCRWLSLFSSQMQVCHAMRKNTGKLAPSQRWWDSVSWWSPG